MSLVVLVLVCGTPGIPATSTLITEVYFDLFLGLQVLNETRISVAVEIIKVLLFYPIMI